MSDLAKVLLGAVLGFIAGLIAEHWKRISGSRVAAMMILRELRFHMQRLRIVRNLDQHPEAEYELKFPSPVWTAQGSTFLAGAPIRKTEAVLNWYASMTVLGNSLYKQVGPNGPVLGGPDRASLNAALLEAISHTEKLAARWNFGRRRAVCIELFDEAAY